MNTIKDLDPQRKCFRLISGVLVERTVGEVLPAVQRNQEQVRGGLETQCECARRL
jgi:prefoldin subunit 2